MTIAQLSVTELAKKAVIFCRDWTHLEMLHDTETAAIATVSRPSARYAADRRRLGSRRGLRQPQRGEHVGRAHPPAGPGPPPGRDHPPPPAQRIISEISPQAK